MKSYNWKEFRNRRITMVLLFLIGFIVILVATASEHKLVFQILGLSLAITGLFYFSNVKCPKCKSKFFKEELLKPLPERLCKNCGLRYSS